MLLFVFIALFILAVVWSWAKNEEEKELMSRILLARIEHAQLPDDRLKLLAALISANPPSAAPKEDIVLAFAQEKVSRSNMRSAADMLTGWGYQ